MVASIIKVLPMIFLALLIGGFFFFRGWNNLILYKNKQAGKKYCEANDLIFIKARSYELHTRVYFEKDGIKDWANYKTDKDYKITWQNDTPIEKLEKKKNL